jgi:hypothetical protein
MFKLFVEDLYFMLVSSILLLERNFDGVAQICEVGSVDKSSVFRKLYINNQNKPLNIFTLSNLIPTMHFWNKLC